MNKLALGLKAFDIAKSLIGKKGAKEAVKFHYIFSPAYFPIAYAIAYVFWPEEAQLFLDGIKAAFGVMSM